MIQKKKKKKTRRRELLKRLPIDFSIKLFPESLRGQVEQIYMGMRATCRIFSSNLDNSVQPLYYAASIGLSQVIENMMP